ncbi:MAG TPA: UDP-3-O-acyl-N-acetylglucosamine deacetylase [Rhizomicrobium sp.]|nr:UDP-3-O-acyl-N-acetylglucosamine deacetylase [Rhizomicrobium sp.]
MRRTLSQSISTTGTALHAGVAVRMTLAPAASGAGVVFRRSDLGGKEVPALYDRVGETRLGTVIGEGGVSVGVIEHLMAAVAGAEIDDMLVTLDGPEPPILDGDALSYLQLIGQAGAREQAGARPSIEVLRRVEVTEGKASAALVPAAADAPGLSFDFEIAFPTPAIGTQRMTWRFSREAFARDIAPARTFGFVQELDMLKQMDRGHGASLQNTLAIDGDTVLNADLMRFPDEFVRHKILDAIGDMALAGAPLIARFEGRKSGHALNNALLRKLMADGGNYRMA